MLSHARLHDSTCNIFCRWKLRNIHNNGIIKSHLLFETLTFITNMADWYRLLSFLHCAIWHVTTVDITGTTSRVPYHLVKSLQCNEAITWANADPDLCHHMASLGCSILTRLDISKNFYLPDLQNSAFSRAAYIEYRRKLCLNPLAWLLVLLAPGHWAMTYIKPWWRNPISQMIHMSNEPMGIFCEQLGEQSITIKFYCNIKSHHIVPTGSVFLKQMQMPYLKFKMLLKIST